VIAKPGHGKTQTLERFILDDIKSDASVVVIDPHGDMFNHLVKRDVGRPVVVLDPKDSPAINPFDVSSLGLESMLENERTQALGALISLYEYFFGSLLGTELTAKQGVLFRYLAHLMISIPSANLNTMIAVMDNPDPFQPFIDQLPTNARNFLTNEFNSKKTFGETREQVKYRLYDLIENPAFDRMFNATKNLVDFSQLNNGAVFLIHADIDFLQEKRASILGRFFIAKTLQMALGRARIPESERHPTYLYIDEAWLFFDSKVQEILDQARKYKLGMVLAHQRPEQASPELMSALKGCGIRLKGNVGEESYLRSTDREAEWECKERGRPPMRLTIPFAWPDYPEEREDYAAFRRANKEALTAPPPPRPPTTAPNNPPEPPSQMS
jgi:DNA helicase HerA-like ATPase